MCLCVFVCVGGSFHYTGDLRDAVRLCRWPNEFAEYCGQTVTGIDGRLIFAGPRVAFAIHRGMEYDLALLASSHPTSGRSGGHTHPLQHSRPSLRWFRQGCLELCVA